MFQLSELGDITCVADSLVPPELFTSPTLQSGVFFVFGRILQLIIEEILS